MDVLDESRQLRSIAGSEKRDSTMGIDPRRDCRRACHFWELHKDNITTSIASFQFPSRSSEHYPVVSARVHLSGFIAFGGGTFVRVAVWKSGFLGSVAAPIRRPHPLAVTDTQSNEVAKDSVGSQLTMERNPKRLRRTPDGPSRLAQGSVEPCYPCEQSHFPRCFPGTSPFGPNLQFHP